MKIKQKLHKNRFILKTITWRIIASLTTLLVSWAITGNITAGLAIGGTEFVLKAVAYYLHERLWYKLTFDK